MVKLHELFLRDDFAGLDLHRHEDGDGCHDHHQERAGHEDSGEHNQQSVVIAAAGAVFPA
jgi:hypothetical protein